MIGGGSNFGGGFGSSNSMTDGGVASSGGGFGTSMSGTGSLDIIGPVLSYMGTKETNQTNKDIASQATLASAEQATRQMHFQERMSNTAYQRAMMDMEEAGLNPILAYQQGGASTPQGAAGTAYTAHMENALGAAVSSSYEARRLRKEIQATESQIGLNEANKKVAAAQEKDYIASAKNLNSMSAKADSEKRLLDIATPTAKAQADLNKRQAEFNKKDSVFYTDQFLKRLNQALGGASSAKDLVMPGRQ